MKDVQPLTGERTAPGTPEENYWFRRHVAAYRFAGRIVRGRAIDAGSGEGYGTGFLSRRAEVVGLELDPDAVVHASRRYAAARFVRADLCSFPLARSTLDAVVALQVIEHLGCVERFVEACGQALRPGGVLVLSTPNRATFPSGINPFHVREYDARELGEVVSARFGAVEVLGIAHRAPLAALDRVLGEPVQHRLVRVPYAENPRWLRALLRTVTSRDFKVTAGADRALDLLVVARDTIEV